MKALYSPVYGMAEYEEIENRLSNYNCVSVSGCINTQKLHYAQAYGQKYKYRVIITYDEARMREMYEDSKFFHKNSVYYPGKDFIFYSTDVQGNQILSQRLQCIKRIADAAEEGITVITTIDGCIDMLVPLSRYIDNSIELSEGDTLEVNELIRRLIAIGYERTPLVEHGGQFAVRGGIIDIYSHTEEIPYRIELWGDEIDSIRSFDADSQRTVEKKKSISVFPSTEYILDEEELEDGLDRVNQEFIAQQEAVKSTVSKRADQINIINNLRRLYGDLTRTKDVSKFINSFCDCCCGFLDYFPKEDTLFVLDEPDRIGERIKLVTYEYQESMKNRLQAGYVLPSQTKLMRDIHDVYRLLSNRRTLILSTLNSKFTGISNLSNYQVLVQGISTYSNDFSLIVKDLKKYKDRRYQTVLVSSSRTRAKRLVDDFIDEGLSAYYSEDFDKDIVPGTVMVTYGSIHKGFEYPLSGYIVIAEGDIFTNTQKKKQKKTFSGKGIVSFNELNINDYVVHESYGLGIYQGITQVEVDGVLKDYIKIQYAGSDCIYILATQLDRLQKYAAADTEKKPKLTKLGGSEWHNTKAKVKSAVDEVAQDLVKLYATRQKEKGYQFGADTVWQTEFEEMFPYEETADQLNAIADTKADMESSRIMDRLICGDVGYGKTEVAIRAAFKAVQEGKQVAYLVPTTILASQHYNNFQQRLKSFPVKVAQLSSFKDKKEIKDILADLKKGFVDIVIGTHRLLSKDVEFKDLGLLIIDEEQRFGVNHKEKIKQLKNNIDVLTLSATPIPRTLHMSLVGIRDMSILEEPPVDRLPIQTFVTEYNDEMVREAINRELARGGQVYYVYNKVNNIEEVADKIRALVPEAVVGFAHGKMQKSQLEGIMTDFINRDIDVLVSTTIIETGMDISNANTMIIENAENFGLSQLYQLRGRVGRSNRTAYAFLLYKRDRMISEVAEKRLVAIKEFSGFGSGYRIAMKDLEIRGAGSVLGKSQHGHMAAVGYDLYCKMLEQAVNKLKGIDEGYTFETSINLDVDAYIPSTYISNEYQKLDIYKRIAAIETEEEMSDMIDELRDRYGALNQPTRNLLEIALIKSKAHNIGIIEIKGGLQTEGRGEYRTVMSIYGKANIDGQALEELVDSFGGSMRLEMSATPKLIWTVTKKKFANNAEYILGLKDVIDLMNFSLTNK